jgi:hypothetical protein
MEAGMLILPNIERPNRSCVCHDIPFDSLAGERI